MSEHLGYYFLLGGLGLLLQTLMRINSLIQKSKIANHSFSFKEYISSDWATIASALVTVAIMTYCIDELLAAHPDLVQYIKWFFVFVGFTGSTIIQSIFSSFSKKINAVINIKTNIADGVNPPVDATNVEGVREIQKDENKVNDSTNPKA